MSDDFIGGVPALGMGPASSAVANAAAEAGSVARAARTEVAELTAEVDRLFAITQALWEILKTERGYDDSALRNTVTALQQSARARKAGGATLPPCAACGRPVSRRHPKCIYCGADTPMDVFAR
jgi:hypothetical protein